MQRLMNRSFLRSGSKGRDNKKLSSLYRRRFGLKISEEKSSSLKSKQV